MPIKHTLLPVAIATYLMSQTAWAGGPPIIVSSPTNLGLTFNTTNCGVGQQVIAGNAASTIDDTQNNNSTYILRVVEPDGGGNNTIGAPYAVDPLVNIPSNSLSFTNTVAHTAGSTLEVRLLCTSGNCATNNGSKINSGTASTFPDEIIATMNYTATCAAAPVAVPTPIPSIYRVPVENNWQLTLLAIFMAMLGAGMLFRKK